MGAQKIQTNFDWPFTQEVQRSLRHRAKKMLGLSSTSEAHTERGDVHPEVRFGASIERPQVGSWNRRVNKRRQSTRAHSAARATTHHPREVTYQRSCKQRAHPSDPWKRLRQHPPYRARSDGAAFEVMRQSSTEP